MKKRFFILIAFTFMLCFILTGCTPTPLTMPTGTISGSNGGSVVKILKQDELNSSFYGYDYLYFANAYKDSNITSENENKNTDIFSIARVKPDKNGDVEKSEKNFAENVEKVVGKIGGFDNKFMAVYGDYLYFTTPNIHKNSKNNQYQFDLSCLFKVKLDGTDLSEIYKFEKATLKICFSNEKIFAYESDGSTGTLKVLDLKNNATKFSDITTEITSIVFPSEEGEEINEIFYTKARENSNDGITGNRLLKYDVNSNTADIAVYAENSETVGLLNYNNGCLIYSISYASNNAVVKSLKGGVTKQHLIVDADKLSTYSDFRYVVSENQKNIYIAFKTQTKLFILDFSASNQDTMQEIASVDATINFVCGNYIIYSTSTSVYRYDIYENETIKIVEASTLKGIDFDGRYIYYYSTIQFEDSSETGTGNLYLFRAESDMANSNTICLSILDKADSDLLK